MNLTSNEQFIDLIEKIAKEFKKKSCFVSELTQISMREIYVLLLIKEKYEVKMQEISLNLGITMPTATVLLDGLINKKLVIRKRDDKDRRTVMVTLSENGKVLLEKAIIHRKEKFNKIFSYLTTDDRENLVKILNNILNKLNEKNE